MIRRLGITSAGQKSPPNSQIGPQIDTSGGLSYHEAWTGWGAGVAYPARLESA